MSPCNRLDLQTLRSQPVMPKNLPDHWHEVAKANSMLENNPSRTQLTVADAKLVVNALNVVRGCAPDAAGHRHQQAPPGDHDPPLRSHPEWMPWSSWRASSTYSFAFTVIAVIPTSAQSNYSAQFGGLKVQVENTITVYSCRLECLECLQRKRSAALVGRATWQ